MALPATDAFTGSAGALSGSWTNTLTAPDTIVLDGSGHATYNNAGEDAIAYWNADSFGNDQYSQCKVNNINSGSGYVGGPSVRVSGSGGSRNAYVYQCGDGLWKCVAGSFSQIVTDPTTWANGDVAKLEVTGTSLKMYKNGVQVGTTQTGQTDLTSGSAGLHVYSSNGAGTQFFDDWEGGNVGGGSNNTQTPGGFGLTMNRGTPVVAITAIKVSPAGFSPPMNLGTPSINTNSNITATPPGFNPAMSLGTFDIQIDTTITGITGFNPAMSRGTPSINIGGNTLFSPPGLSAPMSLGTPTVPITSTMSPSGFALTPALGTPSINTTGLVLSPPGFALSMLLGNPTLQGSTGAATGATSLGLGLRIGL